MRATHAVNGEGEERGHWIPWLFVGFFGFVLVANGVMIWLALSTWTGLETEGAYERGLAFNDELEAARAQAALGWTVDLEVEAGGPGPAEVRLEARDRFGSFVRDAKVRVRLVRPTHAGDDVDLPLAHGTGGTYAAAVDLPLPGQWDVEAVMVSPGGTWRRVERVFVRP